MFARIATRTGVQLPSPPAFARNVVESEGCRAVALAEADTVPHGIDLLRATARQATKKMGNFTYVYVLQSETNPEHF
jgi:hypothetical protein